MSSQPSFCAYCLNHGYRNLFNFPHQKSCRFNRCSCNMCQRTHTRLRNQFFQRVKNQGKSMQTCLQDKSEKQQCAFCKNHGYEYFNIRQHFQRCKFRSCSCLKCKELRGTVIKPKPINNTIASNKRSSSSQEEQSSKRPRVESTDDQLPNCALCQNHGFSFPLKAHHNSVCLYKNCSCSACRTFRKERKTSKECTSETVGEESKAIVASSPSVSVPSTDVKKPCAVVAPKPRMSSETESASPALQVSNKQKNQLGSVEIVSPLSTNLLEEKCEPTSSTSSSATKEDNIGFEETTCPEEKSTTDKEAPEFVPDAARSDSPEESEIPLSQGTSSDSSLFSEVVGMPEVLDDEYRTVSEASQSSTEESDMDKEGEASAEELEATSDKGEPGDKVLMPLDKVNESIENTLITVNSALEDNSSLGSIIQENGEDKTSGHVKSSENGNHENCTEALSIENPASNYTGPEATPIIPLLTEDNLIPNPGKEAVEISEFKNTLSTLEDNSASKSNYQKNDEGDQTGEGDTNGNICPNGMVQRQSIPEVCSEDSIFVDDKTACDGNDHESEPTTTISNCQKNNEGDQTGEGDTNGNICPNGMDQQQSIPEVCSEDSIFVDNKTACDGNDHESEPTTTISRATKKILLLNIEKTNMPTDVQTEQILVPNEAEGSDKDTNGGEITPCSPNHSTDNRSQHTSEVGESFNEISPKASETEAHAEKETVSTSSVNLKNKDPEENVCDQEACGQDLTSDEASLISESCARKKTPHDMADLMADLVNLGKNWQSALPLSRSNSIPDSACLETSLFDETQAMKNACDLPSTLRKSLSCSLSLNAEEVDNSLKEKPEDNLVLENGSKQILDRPTFVCVENVEENVPDEIVNLHSKDIFSNDTQPSSTKVAFGEESEKTTLQEGSKQDGAILSPCSPPKLIEESSEKLCEECGKVFYTPSTYRIHQYLKHKVDSLPTSGKIFRCGECSFENQNEIATIDHQSGHMSIVPLERMLQLFCAFNNVLHLQ